MKRKNKNILYTKKLEVINFYIYIYTYDVFNAIKNSYNIIIKNYILET